MKPEYHSISLNKVRVKMKILSSFVSGVVLFTSVNVYANKPTEFCLNSFEDAVQFICKGDTYNQEEKEKGCIVPMVSILTEEDFKNPNLECFTTDPKNVNLNKNLKFTTHYIIDNIAKLWFKSFKESNYMTDSDITFLEKNNVYIP